MRRFSHDSQAVNRHLAIAYQDELFHSWRYVASGGPEKTSFASVHDVRSSRLSVKPSSASKSGMCKSVSFYLKSSARSIRSATPSLLAVGFSG
jgi:hypothetical protein